MRLRLVFLIIGSLLIAHQSAFADDATPDKQPAADTAEPADEEDFFIIEDGEPVEDEEFVDVFDLHEKIVEKETVKETPVGPTTADEETRKQRMPPLRLWGSVAVGLGGAVLISGVVTGAVSLSLNEDIEKNCPGGDCAPEFHDDLDQRDALALSTSILLGVGGGIAVAGALMVIFSYDWAKPKTEERSGAVAGKKVAAKRAQQTIALRPIVGSTVVGAALDWRF
jgi:hypothetical protein